MLQSIKKYTLCFIELLIYICLVIFYFFRFLFKSVISIEWRLDLKITFFFFQRKARTQRSDGKAMHR